MGRRRPVGPAAAGGRGAPGWSRSGSRWAATPCSTGGRTHRPPISPIWRSRSARRGRWSAPARRWTRASTGATATCCSRRCAPRRQPRVRSRGRPPREIAELDTFRRFDDLVTAPRNGFAGVDDYWAQASCGSRLARSSSRPRPSTRPTIRSPSANDSPLGPGVTMERSPRGGHVGFLTGWWPRPGLPGMVRTIQSTEHG